MGAEWERATVQRAGDTATQIGTVGGNVVHIVRQRLGFWGFLAASIVTLGVLGFGVTLLDKYWSPNPSSDPVAQGFTGWPSHGMSSAMSSAGPGFGDADFGAPVAVDSYGVISGQPVSASNIPSQGLDAQLAQAQLVPIAANIMQFVNSVETQAIVMRDPLLAASVFTGEPLAGLQARIGSLTAWGLYEQPLLEAGSVLAVRIVSSGPWSTVIQIDTCEYWSSTTHNNAGLQVGSEPRHAVPQTVMVEMAGGQVQVLSIDFAVAFPGCL